MKVLVKGPPWWKFFISTGRHDMGFTTLIYNFHGRKAPKVIFSSKRRFVLPRNIAFTMVVSCSASSVYCHCTFLIRLFCQAGLLSFHHLVSALRIFLKVVCPVGVSGSERGYSWSSFHVECEYSVHFFLPYTCVNWDAYYLKLSFTLNCKLHSHGICPKWYAVESKAKFVHSFVLYSHWICL